MWGLLSVAIYDFCILVCSCFGLVFSALVFSDFHYLRLFYGAGSIRLHYGDLASGAVSEGTPSGHHAGVYGFGFGMVLVPWLVGRPLLAMQLTTSPGSWAATMRAFRARERKAEGSQ